LHSQALQEALGEFFQRGLYREGAASGRKANPVSLGSDMKSDKNL
jgi:hypothetical protein